MLSVGKIEKPMGKNLQVDGLDVVAMELVGTDKSWDGVGLLLSTDAGDYLYTYDGDLKPSWGLEYSDVLYGAGLLLSFVPYNY